MITDIYTVMWKEWRELIHQHSQKQKIVLIIPLLFAVLFPLQFGRAWISPMGSLGVWVILPPMLLARLIADTFAGERERHTLETLLASRLSNRAILFGKLITHLLWSWTIAQIIMALSLIPVNIVYGQGELLLYPFDVLLGGLLLSLLTGGLMAGAGVLVSLRASTVQQAQQTLALGLFGLALLPTALIFILKLFPKPVVDSLLTGNLMLQIAPILIGLGLLLAVVDAGLVALALRRFQRTQLILD